MKENPELKIIHQLKVWPEYWSRIRTGQKQFELRKNDRDFQVGDVLELVEYFPDTKQIGHEGPYYFNVDYVLNGPCFGLKKGYCIMSISPTSRP